MLPPFRNEPVVNFAEETHRQRMLEALRQVESELGKEYPLIIGCDQIRTEETFVSVNPARPSQVIGRFAKATPELADKAIRVAHDTFRTWSRVPYDERARYLLKAAAIMRRRLYEMAAWMVYEVSKSWVEAYADVAEAIDFMEFYAREMMRLGPPQPVVDYPGEENELRYIPLGVGAVIPPWNFPLAILTGMTTAAVVTGNTVVLKPASAAPTVAAKFIEIMQQASLPDGVIQFLPGPGGSVGDTLVTHPLTRFIAFTGSKEVGLRIHELAAKPQSGQIWLKRTILEMGGKDCIIIDEDADLESAVEGVNWSAFGYQGQKCSACSRLVIHRAVYDRFLEMVVERAKRNTVGDPVDGNNFMGAVIDEAALRKIVGYIEVGKTEGKLVLGGERLPDEGYFLPPTIFADVEPNARIAQEEIFGPVLSVIQTRDFDHALEIANGTEYGLTGGVYSNNRRHLERARHEFHVGNLYFNRKITGALVGVQPFGGFNMSGTDSKAGGSDYLLLFLQAKSITERW